MTPVFVDQSGTPNIEKPNPVPALRQMSTRYTLRSRAAESWGKEKSLVKSSAELPRDRPSIHPILSNLSAMLLESWGNVEGNGLSVPPWQVCQ